VTVAEALFPDVTVFPWASLTLATTAPMVVSAIAPDGWVVMRSFVAVEWVMVKALEATDVRPLEAKVRTLLVPTSSIPRALKVATPDDADTDVVPDSVPSPVVIETVTVAVALFPDVTVFP